MKRPDRDDYEPCRCNDVAEHLGAREFANQVCRGCEEYDAALRDWIDSYDPYAAADGLADMLKDEDIHRG